ncbi:MAG: hypothetical protein RBS80_28155 [Thermoguttaceae bacterium]|nr:hypothetical protein [Thermoguttaceae bacterium]
MKKRREERAAQEAREAAKATAKAEAEKKKKEEEHRRRVEAEKRKREEQQRQWQAKAQEQKQAEPEEPPFPENPAEWNKDDFPKARAAGEPRLVEAVEHLGRTFPTSEPAVATLVELLKPVGAAGKPAGQPLIEAIVVALGRNETRQATQALRNLVDGNLEAELPSIARSTAMRVLADRDASLFDDLLLAALRSADGDQQSAAATRSAYDWEADLLRLIEDRAGPALRLRVARHALEPTTSARQRGRLLELLTRPAPANLSAQVILLASPATDSAAKAVLARQLAMVSSCALQRLQGMPASVTPAFSAAARPAGGRTATYGITSYGSPSAAKPTTAAGGTMGIYDDPNLLRYAPAALWNEQSAKLVVRSLFQLETLDRSPHHLQLAATIPIRRVREEWLAGLRRNWRDGPGGLRKAGVPGQVVFDPVLPVLLKTLPYATPEAKDWRRQLLAASKGNLQPPRQQRFFGGD